MNRIKLHITVVGILIFTACSNSSTESETKNLATPKTPVQVVSIHKGIISNKITLFGSSNYLKRNLLTAPIPSFISKINIHLGDKVHKGDVLFVLQSKESKALSQDTNPIDSTLPNLGVIKVKASASGIISTLDKQQAGEYVLEGTQLCSIVESNNLVFQVNVPYEYTPLTKHNNSCTIILPNNNKIEATFTKSLTSMNPANQTQTVLAKANKQLILPENMVVKILVKAEQEKETQLLPKSCVLSNEMLSEYWVMKIINDSTAIKIPISIGNKNLEEIAILSPQFSSTDKIISVGNYGLTDTAFVKIDKE